MQNVDIECDTRRVNKNKKKVILFILVVITISIFNHVVGNVGIYYLDQIRHNEYIKGYMGTDVRVAVLDTGIEESSDLIKDPYRILNFTDSPTAYDENGHGTKMLQILCDKDIGVAPNIEIYSLKVLDENGEGCYIYTINAIRWCIENNIQIINISVATSTDYQELKKIIEEAVRGGIIIVASFGNFYTTQSYPASYENVIGVYTDLTDNKYNHLNSILCPVNKFYSDASMTDGCIGNSPATAYCSGICARLIERNLENNLDYDSTMIVELLKSILE